MSKPRVWKCEDLGYDGWFIFTKNEHRVLVVPDNDFECVEKSAYDELERSIQYWKDRHTQTEHHADKLAEALYESHVEYCDRTGDDCKACASYEEYRRTEGAGQDEGPGGEK